MAKNCLRQTGNSYGIPNILVSAVINWTVFTLRTAITLLKMHWFVPSHLDDFSEPFLVSNTRYQPRNLQMFITSPPKLVFPICVSIKGMESWVDHKFWHLNKLKFSNNLLVQSFMALRVSVTTTLLKWKAKDWGLPFKIFNLLNCLFIKGFAN